MEARFNIGDFVVYEDMIVKVISLGKYSEYSTRPNGPAIGFLQDINDPVWYTPTWYVNGTDRWFRELHISDFQAIREKLRKGIKYRDETNTIKKFLGEALIWYLARNEYEPRTVPSETNRICEIPF